MIYNALKTIDMKRYYLKYSTTIFIIREYNLTLNDFLYSLLKNILTSIFKYVKMIYWYYIHNMQMYFPTH